MSLFDSSEEHPPHKVRRYVITGVAFLALVALTVWWFTRFRSEKRTVATFMDALVAGQTEQAYHLWKPTPVYGYADFLQDWGPNGEYGPVRSYQVEDAERLTGSSCVVVAVDVSPFQPFPGDQDPAKQSKTQTVKICVRISDQTMIFAP